MHSHSARSKRARANGEWLWIYALHSNRREEAVNETRSGQSSETRLRNFPDSLSLVLVLCRSMGSQFIDGGITRHNDHSEEIIGRRLYPLKVERDG